jgi:hypothetical protein
LIDEKLRIVLAPAHISGQEYKEADKLKSQMADDSSNKHEMQLIIYLLRPVGASNLQTRPHYAEQQNQCYHDVDRPFLLVSLPLYRQNPLQFL